MTAMTHEKAMEIMIETWGEEIPTEPQYCWKIANETNVSGRDDGHAEDESVYSYYFHVSSGKTRYFDITYLEVETEEEARSFMDASESIGVKWAQKNIKEIAPDDHC